MVISYGDSIYSKNKDNFKIFYNFFNKKLNKFVNAVISFI